MTVKRILSVVLSVMMIMASLVSVSATNVAESIDVGTELYTITVTVKVPDEIKGKMTAQILNTGKTELFAIASSDSKADGAYTLTLTMPESADSGEYTVRVGGNIDAAEKTFKYTTVKSYTKFYNEFIENKSDVAALQSYLEDCKDAPDLTDYKKLVKNIKTVVTSKLATIDNLVKVEIADPEYKIFTKEELKVAIEAVVENSKVFGDAYASEMAMAGLIDVKSVEELQNVIDKNSEYFALYEGKEPAITLTAEDVYSYYKEEAKAVDTVEEFNVENFGKLFSQANLVAVAKSKGKDYLKEAYLTIVGETDLINKDTDGDLWNDLYLANNTNYAKLVENAIDIASNPGGSSDGGSTSKDSIDTPTTPATPGAPVEKPSTSAFVDLGTAEWAREAIEALAAKGVLNGKSAGRFVPNDNVTREEITKIITSAFGLVQNDAECEFADVAADRWSYVYVASASRLGIVNGYGADFGPANKTTREDMAVMIYRVLKLMNINVSGTVTNFSDASSISPYARDAVKALTSAGIINGMGNGTFAPKEYVTRAQIAKVAYELLNLAGGNQ